MEPSVFKKHLLKAIFTVALYILVTHQIFATVKKEFYGFVAFIIVSLNTFLEEKCEIKFHIIGFLAT